MLKMPAHPAVFIIVMEQGELGKGTDEKDFCFPLYFSTYSDGFPSSLENWSGVGAEWGMGGGRAGPAARAWRAFPGTGGHRAPKCTRVGPTEPAAHCRAAPRPTDPQSQAEGACVLWENWLITNPFL